MLARNEKIKKHPHGHKLRILRYVSTFHFGNDTASEQKVNFSRLPKVDNLRQKAQRHKGVKFLTTTKEQLIVRDRNYDKNMRKFQCI